MSRPIRLRATDGEDLKVVSACLQDAIVPINDMSFLQIEQRFVLVANRFKWETVDRPRPGPTADDDHLMPYERTNCGVRFEGIAAVRLKGINLRDRSQILELLLVETVPGGVDLHFAGGGVIRLEGTEWTCWLEDLGEPWPTDAKPAHPLDD